MEVKSNVSEGRQMLPGRRNNWKESTDHETDDIRLSGIEKAVHDVFLNGSVLETVGLDKLIAVRQVDDAATFITNVVSIGGVMT